MLSLLRHRSKRLTLYNVLALLLLTTLLSSTIAGGVFYHRYLRPARRPPRYSMYNWAIRYTPQWTHHWWNDLYKSPMGPPGFHPGLLASIWPGDVPVPALTAHPLQQDEEGNVFLMLHIFSTHSYPSRTKRNLIRQLALLDAIPPEYRHLVEINFVIGYPDPEVEMSAETKKEEEQIAIEAKTYGDMIRLKGLLGGDNMNQGRSWDWIRHVGRVGAPRKSWYLIKCDDDTVPIIPNILDNLVKLDPSVPRYFGTSLGHWVGMHYYFQGMMYGFNWGVIRSIALADVPRGDIEYNFHEDARIGSIMYSLASGPQCDLTPSRPELPTYCSHLTPPLYGWHVRPPSPDPRTGLVRTDFGDKIGYPQEWWIAREVNAMAWHGMKSLEYYTEIWDQIQREWAKHGKEYIWHAPEDFEKYAWHGHGHSERDKKSEGRSMSEGQEEVDAGEATRRSVPRRAMLSTAYGSPR